MQFSEGDIVLASLKFLLTAFEQILIPAYCGISMYNSIPHTQVHSEDHIYLKIWKQYRPPYFWNWRNRKYIIFWANLETNVPQGLSDVIGLWWNCFEKKPSEWKVNLSQHHWRHCFCCLFTDFKTFVMLPVHQLYFI